MKVNEGAREAKQVDKKTKASKGKLRGYCVNNITLITIHINKKVSTKKYAHLGNRTCLSDP